MHFSRVTSSPSLFVLLLTTFLLGCVSQSSSSSSNNNNSADLTYFVCFGDLKASDQDNNQVLSSSEFATLVKSITNGYLNINSQSPYEMASINAAYDSRVNTSLGGMPFMGALQMLNGQTVTDPSSLATAEGFCNDLFTQLYLVYGVDYLTKPSCRIAFTRADTNSDSILTQTEFVNFTYWVQEKTPPSPSSSSSQFSSLASNVQDTFFAFTNAGSSGNPKINATNQRTRFTVALCDQTLLAEKVNQKASRSNNNNNTTTGSSPTPVPGPSAATMQCVQAALFFDSGNQMINENEYPLFVNYLGSNAFPKSFATLPAALQNNYQSLIAQGYGTTANGLNFTGMTQTPIPTADEQRIAAICSATEQAIQLALVQQGGNITLLPTPAPIVTLPSTPSPTPAKQVFPGSMLPTAAPLSVVQTLQCKSAMTRADANSDNQLDSTEYLTFINALSTGTLSYPNVSDLPTVLANNFVTLATNYGTGNAIDIAGSKPYDSPSAAQSQEINSICAATWQAIDQVLAGVTPSPAGNQPSATSSPTNTMNNTVSSTFYYQCTVAMLYGDLNRDNELVSSEYVRFIDRLENPNPTWTNFSMLPTIFQNNFDSLAGSNGFIDVTGSKPGSNPTSSQTSHLEQVCASVQQAMNQYNTGGGSYVSTAPATGLPVMSPSQVSGGLTPSPGFALHPTVAPTTYQNFFTQCTTDLFLSDINANNELSQSEYVAFVYQLAGYSSAPAGLTFADLPPALQTTFLTLQTSNNGINITGAFPNGSPSSAAEQAHLQTVCNAVKADLHLLLAPTSAPAKSSGTAGPTPASGGSTPGTTASPTTAQTLMIKNAFYISNTDGLTAATLGSKVSFIHLSYTSLVENVVHKLNGTFRARSLVLRGRRLNVVGVTTGSPAIYKIIDSNCLASVPNGSTCQTVYSSFLLDLTGSNNDPASINQTYTNATQNAIDAGQLESILNAMDPNIGLQVDGAATPVVPPSNTTSTNSTSGSKSGLSRGAAVGIALAVAFVVLVLFAALDYAFCRRKRIHEKSLAKELSENKTMNYDDAEEYGFNPDADPVSIGNGRFDIHEDHLIGLKNKAGNVTGDESEDEEEPDTQVNDEEQENEDFENVTGFELDHSNVFDAGKVDGDLDDESENPSTWNPDDYVVAKKWAPPERDGEDYSEEAPEDMASTSQSETEGHHDFVEGSASGEENQEEFTDDGQGAEDEMDLTREQSEVHDNSAPVEEEEIESSAIELSGSTQSAEPHDSEEVEGADVGEAKIREEDDSLVKTQKTPEEQELHDKIMALAQEVIPEEEIPQMLVQFKGKEPTLLLALQKMATEMAESDDGKVVENETAKEAESQDVKSDSDEEESDEESNSEEDSDEEEKSDDEESDDDSDDEGGKAKPSKSNDDSDSDENESSEGEASSEEESDEDGEGEDQKAPAKNTESGDSDSEEEDSSEEDSENEDDKKPTLASGKTKDDSDSEEDSSSEEEDEEDDDDESSEEESEKKAPSKPAVTADDSDSEEESSDDDDEESSESEEEEKPTPKVAAKLAAKNPDSDSEESSEEESDSDDDSDSS